MRRASFTRDPHAITWRLVPGPLKAAAVRRAMQTASLEAKAAGRPYRRPGPREYLAALLELDRGAR